jgi:L-fucose isomerase-like protein
MHNMQPRVGLVTCVHPIYNLPSVVGHRDAAIAGLQAAGCYVAAPEIARDSRDVRAIARLLGGEEIDLLLFFFCTWVAEEITLGLSRELADVPLLLWALPYLDKNIPMPSPMTGLTATGCNIRKSGRSFAHMVGPATPEHIAKAAGAARVAAVVKGLRQARFGIIGHPCPGMIDTGCDDAALQKCLGAAVVHRDLDNFLRAAREADPAEASSRATDLASRVGRCEVDHEKLSDHYRLVLGMKSMVEADRLDGFTIRCWPELRDHHKTTVCLTLAEMAEAGIPNACESDVTALVTSYVMTRIAGAPSYSMEITAYLDDQRALQFAHCGSAPLSFAAGPEKASVRGHMRTGAGALLEFPFKPGTVTIAKLLRPSGDRMKMFLGRGEVIATDPDVRGSVATIRPEPSPDAFLDTMLREAVEHHLVIVYGDWTAELAQFAAFANVDLV